MSLRDRILPIQTEPEQVDRAPRHERWRRGVWMIVSTIIGFGVVGVCIATVMRLVPVLAAGETTVWALAAAGMVLGFGLDAAVFRWGVDRFDLVAPWQFREAEKAEKTEADQ